MKQSAGTNPSILHLQCDWCERRYDPAEVTYVCSDCGPLKGTLTVEYDLERVGKQLTKDSLARDPERSHWRYLPMMPVVWDSPPPWPRVGSTPIYESARLERRLGVGRLHVKDDGLNPSGSLKDRASSVGVSMALALGAERITAASTGNAASSVSVFAAAAGLPATIFVPRTAPEPKVAQLLAFGAQVLQVDGTYDQAFDLCLEATDRWGWYSRNTGFNPYLAEGKKTVALEIAEQLNWSLPDLITVGVGDGNIFGSLYKGLRELKEMGLTSTIPRLVGVQAEGSAPLVHAFDAGDRITEAIEAETLADSICVGNPRDPQKALRSARATGGRILSVSDDEILEAIRLLAREAGVFAEPAGAAGTAGLAKLAREEDLSTAWAVSIVTGNGLKDVRGAMAAAAAKPTLVTADMDSVAAAVGR